MENDVNRETGGRGSSEATRWTHPMEYVLVPEREVDDSSTLSIPPPKFLSLANLRLEGKVFRLGRGLSACPGRTTQTVSAQFNVRVD